MPTMGQRLQEALDRRQLQPTDVIRGTKLSKGTIYNILNDTTKPEKIWGATAKRISSFLRISSDWLLTGRGDMDDVPADNFDTDWMDIIADPTGLAAGGGVVPEDYPETHKLKFRESSLRRKGLHPGGNPNRLRVEYVRGDSMLPRLHDGDALLVDTSDNTRIVNGAIYWIRHDGEHYVKQLHRAGDTIVIESMNKADPQWRVPRIVSKGDEFEIIGRVRWIGSWED